MKRLLIIVSAILVTIPLSAQKALENDEIIATVGVNVPMYKNMESDVVVGLHYGHYYPNGVGFRAGFQYIPTVVEIDNSFSVPLAVTYRTGSRSRSTKLTAAAHGVAGTQVYEEEDILKYGLVNFLMNLFDRLEFHAGLTPGYVAGKSRDMYPSYHNSGMGYWEKTWTEKPSSFSLSADAGLGISFRIWRFDLKLMPAFHYNITNNYRYHIQEGVRGSDEVIRTTIKPIKWFFTFNGGLAFRF
ncbi:MAG: hypothetical protein IJB06_06005 [Bacteroidales bacterium]|nr:hypothetical protein [Bacteroidales bacterium]